MASGGQELTNLLLNLRSPRDYVGSSVRACGTSLVRWMALQCANRTASRLAKRIVYEISQDTNEQGELGEVRSSTWEQSSLSKEALIKKPMQ